MTTRPPGPTSRAICSADHAIAPALIPTKSPSSRARRRASGKASSSHTIESPSRSDWSRFGGMKPGPIP